jgi:hypothetical protein
MRVLELYAGLKGWSQPFADRGHDVVTLDYLPHFDCDITIDILEWDYRDFERPDIILASPPCEKFSTMGFQYGWFRQIRTRYEVETEPVTAEARHALSLVAKAVEIIDYFDPEFWVIENPKALLRKLAAIPAAPTSVWYCHYGEERAKPTDLWRGGNWRTLRLEPPCHNQRAGHPPDCCCRDHNPAPRGSRTGTQGMDRELSAKIPYPLAESVCLAAERDLVGTRGDQRIIRTGGR